MSIGHHLLIMGNENNNSNTNNKKKNSSQNIKKIISKNNASKDAFQTPRKENNDFQTKKPARFATVFQWDGGGTNVYLTGSFCDWQQFFVMQKCEDIKNENNNKFFLTLFLPIGAYQYKFKIDDKWKCNSNFPTCSDKNGNINNIIDLTKHKKDEGITDFSTSYVTTRGPEAKNDSLQTLFNDFNYNDYNNLSKTQNDDKNYSDNSSIGYNFKNGFGDLLPNKEENEISNKQKDKEEYNLFEISYKQIYPLRHEHFEHLFVNINTFKKYSHSKNLVYSCSFRFGFKATTIIYYKPPLKNG